MRALATVLLCVVLTACSVGVSGSSSSRLVVSTPAATTPAETAPPASSTPPPKPRTPAPVNACRANSDPQRVIVSLRHQHAWLCERSRTVLDTPITTGRSAEPYYATPTGLYHVQSRQRDVTLYPLSGGAYPVKYWVTFDAPLFGFHDASWQTIPFGSGRYRTEGSHGCVHLPLAAMRSLYNWARVGATVSICP